ncbi:hypothetical protein [Burkholderia ubonensis]|uniref:hypothetical protein n=1 Tax=Burkholderia ubonensis TaxID=101571 RepID=UPI0012F8E39A|nr:hypothetical protein [Burkholderia ubonensis]
MRSLLFIQVQSSSSGDTLNKLIVNIFIKFMRNTTRASTFLCITIIASALGACGGEKKGDSPPPTKSPTASPMSGWSLIDSHSIRFLDAPNTALTRTQGIAYDTQSNSVIFSGRTGLEKTDTNFNSIQSNTLAIPASIFKDYRSDHIGCHDIFQGEIFAPLEDEKTGYRHPIIAKYDANSLSYSGKSVELPRDADQDDGVPWVAVDASRQMLYTMKYSNATKLNQFKLDSLWNGKPERKQLTLSAPLSSVQCAKVSGDYLYLLTNDSRKSIKSINLLTGTVTNIFNLADHFKQTSTDQVAWESEGLAFYSDKNGAALHLTAISSQEVLGKSIPSGLTVFNFKQNQ